MKQVLFAALSLLILNACSTLSGNGNTRTLNLERQWVASTYNDIYLGYRHAHQMSPAIMDDYVFQGNAVDGLVAFDRNKGQQNWRIDVANGVSSGSFLAEDKIFFGASDGHFYAADLATGRLSWAFPTRVENLAPPLVHNQTVYFLSGNDVVYALKSDNGQQKWIYARSSTIDLSIRGGTRPAAFQNTIFVGFSDGFLVALDSKDGSLMWERQLSTNPKFKDIDSSPIIEGNFVYVSSYDNYLYCLSRQDGQIIWRAEEGGAFPVSINQNTLFYSTSTGKVKAINKQNGEVLWTNKLPSGVATQPIVYGANLVYGESDGPLRVVDAKTGAHLTHYETGRGVASAPAIDLKTGQIIVMSNEGNLHSLKLKWVTNLDSHPAVYNNKIGLY